MGETRIRARSEGTSDPIGDWSALRERLAALQVVKCRMVHERLRWEHGQLVRIHRGEPEPVLARLGLCRAEVREQRLACGHTMARHHLHQALRDLHEDGVLSEPEYVQLDQELNAVGNEIHLLDHRKGDAERWYAVLAEGQAIADLETAESCIALEKAAAEVRALESEHDRYVEQLGAWRGRLLQLIDRALVRGAGDSANVEEPLPGPPPPVMTGSSS